MLILKATEYNWGLIGPGDWEKHSWKINDDGWYQYKESYRNVTEEIPEIPTITAEGVLTKEQIEKLKGLVSEDWSEEKTDACDGTAWEFKMYQDGKVIKHRDLGYIYGIEPYESIAGILKEE